MTHRQKVNHLIADLRQQGIGPFTAAPPLFRLLWVLGLTVPPPFFLGSVPLTLLLGTVFGILWGAVTWLLRGEALRVSVVQAVLEAISAGLLFGLFMTRYYRRKAAELRLPSWENYARTEPVAESTRSSDPGSRGE